ncbi:hypothetical protein ALQ47_05252 [Pseudomonas cichorii]|nr:hypothetical protein ALQ47_05252 [Pseudomonas cichorii]
MATDHVPDMQLGQFVVGQVQHRETLIRQAGDQGAARIVVRVGLHADEDMRLTVGVIAVVEFGDLPLADSLAERLEAARLLGNGHGNDGFAAFTQLGTLGHMAQAVEVDVGTGVDGHQGLTADAALLHILLDPGHAQRTGRLGDGAGVVVDVLDGRADLVGADGDDFIDVLAADLEGVMADLRHGHAIGKQPDLIQHHPLTRCHGDLQAVGVVRLDADNLDVRAQVFDVGRDARNQPATAHRDENGVQLARLLAQDFHGHRALSGDGVRVIVRVDVDEALLVHQFEGVGQGFREGVAMQHHLSAPGAHAFDLDLGGGLGHDDGGLDAHFSGGQRQALGMVACRSRHHAASQFFRAQLRQLVVGTADLEGEHRLQVFALEQYLVGQPLGKLAGALQRGFDSDVIDAGSEDFLDVLFEHRGVITDEGSKAEKSTLHSDERPYE